FNAGQMPAIDSGLSVSRVGGAAQFPAMKKVSRSLKIDLANFQEMKSFAQFGSDLDRTTLSILKHGEVLMRVLRQNQYEPNQLDRQVYDLFAAKTKKLDDLELKEVKPFLNNSYKHLKVTNPDIFEEILKTKDLSEENANRLTALINEEIQIYKK
ncbi:MAG: F0F1 ATP synthase subunit alpha, partial [Bacilli bacterium]|nr:F0F1 ATP synthase subunit alpha [Bacilli bacterium]